jgi:hypothetical protein
MSSMTITSDIFQAYGEYVAKQSPSLLPIVKFDHLQLFEQVHKLHKFHKVLHHVRSQLLYHTNLLRMRLNLRHRHVRLPAQCSRMPKAAAQHAVTGAHQHHFPKGQFVLHKIGLLDHSLRHGHFRSCGRAPPPLSGHTRLPLHSQRSSPLLACA